MAAVLIRGDLMATFALFIRATPLLYDFCLARLRRNRPDVLVIDGIALWGEMLGRRLGIPTIVTSPFFAYELSGHASAGRELRVNLGRVFEAGLAARHRLDPRRLRGVQLLPLHWPFMPVRGDLTLMLTSRELHPRHRLCPPPPRRVRRRLDRPRNPARALRPRPARRPPGHLHLAGHADLRQDRFLRALHRRPRRLPGADAAVGRTRLRPVALRRRARQFHHRGNLSAARHPPAHRHLHHPGRPQQPARGAVVRRADGRCAAAFRAIAQCRGDARGRRRDHPRRRSRWRRGVARPSCAKPSKPCTPTSTPIAPAPGRSARSLREAGGYARAADRIEDLATSR